MCRMCSSVDVSLFLMSSPFLILAAKSASTMPLFTIFLLPTFTGRSLPHFSCLSLSSSELSKHFYFTISFSTLLTICLAPAPPSLITIFDQFFFLLASLQTWVIHLPVLTWTQMEREVFWVSLEFLCLFLALRHHLFFLCQNLDTHFTNRVRLPVGRHWHRIAYIKNMYSRVSQVSIHVAATHQTTKHQTLK